jgi:membrane protease YdiL (CAAX protease family)
LTESRARIWTEILALYLGSCLLIRGIKVLVDSGTLANDWLVLVAIVFLYTPVAAEKWNRFTVDHDITFPDPFWPAAKKALIFFGVVTAVIYVFFLPGYHVAQTWFYNWFTTEVMGMRRGYPTFSPSHAITGGIALTIAMQVLYQLLCVGYAEEFFYRGYMQTRLDGLYDPERFELFGAKFGWALPITAVLFTLGHSLVTWQWWQPFILFPALAFGWMRARSGNILAGALFHTWANSLMIILDHIYGISPLEETTLGDLWGDVAGIFTWFGELFS